MPESPEISHIVPCALIDTARKTFQKQDLSIIRNVHMTQITVKVMVVAVI